MADFVSHLLMAEEVLKGLNGEARKLIERNIHAFNLGSQGPDFIFYKKSKTALKLNGIGDMLHSEDINKTLNYMLNFAKSQNSYEKEAILAYAYGYILHYDFDKLMHAYVGKTTGALFSVPHEKYKKNNLIQHYKLEAEIDAQLYFYFKGEQIYKLKKSFDRHYNLDCCGIIATMWVNFIKEFYNIETKFFDIHYSIKNMFKIRKMFLNKTLVVLLKPIFELLNKKLITAHIYPNVKCEPYKEVLNIFNKAKDEGVRDILLVHLGKGIDGTAKMSDGL